MLWMVRSTWLYAAVAYSVSDLLISLLDAGCTMHANVVEPLIQGA